MNLFGGQRSPINAHTVNVQYLPYGKAYKLQTWYTDRGRRPASSTSAVSFKVEGQGHKVTWRVWQVLAHKSRTKRPRNSKIYRKLAHPTGDKVHQFQGQRSKVKVTRPINAYTVNAQYLANGKAYELQTWYADRRWRPTSLTSDLTSKVKVARSRDESDRCWPISRERNVLSTSKLVRRLSIPRAIICTSFKVIGQSSRSPGRLMLTQ